MPDPTDQLSRLEAAIAAQEALRPTLGDSVVDVTLAALRAQVSTLRNRRQTIVPPPTEPPDQLLSRLQGYLPKELADKMRATGRIEGERRQVTVLFADISGFTALSEGLDPEDVVSMTNEVLKDMAEAVYRYEGYVDKFLGDAVMAVFGAPIAHEDDPERALRAAIEMRERIEQFNRRNIALLPKPLSLHIGVNTGMVVAGNVGSDLRMSYTVMGDTVNTASRLEGATQAGQILVSRDTYRLTREAFTFLAMEPIRVKGKREPLMVYQLHRSRLAPGKSRGLQDLSHALVGRESEMAQMKDVFAGLKAGCGHIVVVSGEAGIGKSRLLSELRHDITNTERVHWLEGRCLAHTSSVSYAPFLDLIRQHAGIRDDHCEDAARWRLDLAVSRLFPEDAEAKAILASMMALRLSPEEGDLLKRIESEQFRQRIFALMLSFFKTFAQECPTILVIEDIHWADTTSLELIEHLLPLTQRLALATICVCRTDSSGTSEPWAKLMAKICGRYSERFTEVNLKALSEMSSLEMVARLLSLDDLPSALKGLIAGRAEGNPFFVEELIRTLIEHGALARSEGGRWEVTPLIESIAVPDTLQGLLMSRLDRLPPETKWLAQQASVIGRIFLYRVLLHMADRKAGVDDDLSRMEAGKLIRERARDPELEYMFRHALTQETAYRSLLGPRRKELHRRTARAMEEIFEDRIGEFLTVIGEHFLQGEAWDKASAYLIRAGDNAARLFALAEARLHYARALEALTHLPPTEANALTRAHTLIKLVSVSWASDRPEQNMARLSEAERLVQEHLGTGGPSGRDRLLMARVRYWMGRIHLLKNAMPEAIDYYRLVLAAAQELGDPELLAMPSQAIGTALYLQGHFGKAREMERQAIGPLEQLGKWVDWVRVVSFHGMTLAATGSYEEGLAECRRALARARQMNSLNETGMGNMALARIYADAGNLPRAAESLRQALEAYEQSGDRIPVYLGYVVIAYAQVCAGELDAAAQSIGRHRALAKELGGQLMFGDIAAATAAEVALGKGRIEQALSMAKRTVAMARKMGGIWGEGMARQVWGRALAALDPPQWDEAEAQMAESLRLFEMGEARLYAARTHMQWGMVCRDRGNTGAAREHYEKAAAQWKTSNIPWELERVSRLIAQLT